MTMKLQLALFGFLCCVISMAHSESIQFQDCSAAGYKVEKLDISPCPKMPCEFIRGTNISERAIYKVENNGARQSSLRTLVRIYPDSLEGLNGILEAIGSDGPVGLPYPLPDSNTCNFLDPPCPIHPGQSTEYSDTIEIYSVFPPMSGTLRAEKINEVGETIFCFSIPFKLI